MSDLLPTFVSALNFIFWLVLCLVFKLVDYSRFAASLLSYLFDFLDYSFGYIKVQSLLFAVFTCLSLSVFWSIFAKYWQNWPTKSVIIVLLAMIGNRPSNG